MNYFVKRTLRENINSVGAVWYHGTADVNKIIDSGGFQKHTIQARIITDLSKMDELSKLAEDKYNNGDEAGYHEVIDQIPKLKKIINVPKPVFMSNNFQVAKTYADPKRSLDYQNADEKVLKLHHTGNKGLTINAQGDNFRTIGFDRVVNGLISSGIDSDTANNAIRSLTYHNLDNIRTDDISVIANQLGFDYVDVLNVIDSYSSGNTKSTVRMVFDPSTIKILNLND